MVSKLSLSVVDNFEGSENNGFWPFNATTQLIPHIVKDIDRTVDRGNDEERKRMRAAEHCCIRPDSMCKSTTQISRHLVDMAGTTIEGPERN